MSNGQVGAVHLCWRKPINSRACISLTLAHFATVHRSASPIPRRIKFLLRQNWNTTEVPSIKTNEMHYNEGHWPSTGNTAITFKRYKKRQPRALSLFMQVGKTRYSIT